MTKPLSDGDLHELVARLPDARAFTSAEADDRGVPHATRRLLVDRKLLVPRARGVFHLAALADTLDLRLECLALVVPTDCVVTDRTAAWLWVGDRALAPGEHRCLPRVSMFAPPGRRLRNGLTVSGERRLEPRDVIEVGALRVTSPLRTACDLGRLLTADQGFAAMDSMASIGTFEVDELVEEVDRFKGYRGVVQLRTWAPFVDPASDSQFESIGRRRWLTAGLPKPRCQCPETAADGSSYFVDFGLPGERFGGEYFGEEFHGQEQAPHDDARLAWLREAKGWTIVVARRDDVVGPHQNLEQVFRREWRRHRTSRTVLL